MHTTSMNLNILSAVNSAKRVEQMRPPKLQHVPKLFKWLIDRFVTRRLEKHSFRIADACSKLQIVSLNVQRRSDTDLIDSDFSIRGTLESMKQDLKALRVEMCESFNKAGFSELQVPRLYKAHHTMVKLLGEMYEIATEVQWAIAEHDATNSKRHDGFVASNAAELDEILARISSGA